MEFTPIAIVIHKHMYTRTVPNTNINNSIAKKVQETYSAAVEKGYTKIKIGKNASIKAKRTLSVATLYIGRLHLLSGISFSSCPEQSQAGELPYSGNFLEG